MWLLSSPQVADEPELKSTWCCRREGCWGAGITKSELQTSLGLSETLVWGGEGWQGSWCCCAVSGSGCLPKGASLLLCWFGRAQPFPTTYSISLSWAAQAEFQEYSVLHSPPSSIPLCPCVVSLGLGLQNGKKRADPVVFSQLRGFLLVFLTRVCRRSA